MFCKKLKESRKKAGISQVRAAIELNTTQTTISKYETGKLEPNLSTLKQLCIL